MGLSLANKAETAAEPSVKLEKEEVLSYQFSQEAESITQSSVFGQKKKRRTRISEDGWSQATSMGDVSCKHLQILSQNLSSKMEEEEKDDGQ